MTDLNHLRHRLEIERKTLLERLKTSPPPVEESPYGKEGEAASEAIELEKHRAMERHTKELLAEVEHALAKFEQGTYGLCEGCGQPIELARLETLPWTRRCLNCKTHEEGGLGQ